MHPARCNKIFLFIYFLFLKKIKNPSSSLMGLMGLTTNFYFKIPFNNDLFWVLQSNRSWKLFLKEIVAFFFIIQYFYKYNIFILNYTGVVKKNGVLTDLYITLLNAQLWLNWRYYFVVKSELSLTYFSVPKEILHGQRWVTLTHDMLYEFYKPSTASASCTAVGRKYSRALEIKNFYFFVFVKHWTKNLNLCHLLVLIAPLLWTSFCDGLLDCYSQFTYRVIIVNVQIYATRMNTP